MCLAQDAVSSQVYYFNNIERVEKNVLAKFSLSPEQKTSIAFTCIDSFFVQYI